MWRSLTWAGCLCISIPLMLACVARERKGPTVGDIHSLRLAALTYYDLAANGDRAQLGFLTEEMGVAQIRAALENGEELPREPAVDVLEVCKIQSALGYTRVAFKPRDGQASALCAPRRGEMWEWHQGRWLIVPFRGSMYSTSANGSDGYAREVSVLREYSPAAEDRESVEQLASRVVDAIRQKDLKGLDALFAPYALDRVSFESWDHDLALMSIICNFPEEFLQAPKALTLEARPTLIMVAGSSDPGSDWVKVEAWEVRASSHTQAGGGPPRRLFTFIRSTKGMALWMVH